MTFQKKGSLKRLIDHLPVVVFEYTFFPDGHRDFTYVSPRCEELLGVNPEALTRGHLQMINFIHPEDWQSFNESVEEKVRLMKEWRWEGRCRGKHDYIWLSAQGTPVKMKDGRIVYNGVFFDISKQKQLNSKHVETEQRYKELVEQLPLGIAIHSGGKVRFANTHAARMIGASSPSDLIGKELTQFIHPESVDVVRSRIKSIQNGVPAPPIEEKYVRFDGKVIDVETFAYPYQFEGENAIQVVFSDITERKKSEARFKKTETLFSQLFQNTPLAVTFLNEKGNVVQINKGFYEMFGFSIEELEGKGLNQFIVPNDLESEGNDINTLISSNRVVRMETVRNSKSGREVSVIIYGVPVHLQDETIGIFGMYVDITERKKVEEELKIRNTELDNFVYKVSHDLRAPLSSILGLAHLAGIPGNTDNLADYIKLMGQKAEQLDHFISDVLSHSKNLKMEVKVCLVDLRKVVEQTFNDLNYLHGADSIERTISVTGDDFYSDPWRIAEIFRNLVSNAIKYRKLDTQQSSISIHIETSATSCVILFQDNGIGIDRDKLGKIFEMFYRASDQSEGSGLGLYIVKNAIEMIGGDVTVESESGKGTLFKIILPNHRLSK